MKFRKTLIYSAVVAAIVGYYAVRSSSGQEAYPVVSAESVKLPAPEAGNVPYYLELQRQYETGGFRRYAGEPIDIAPDAFVGAKDGAKTEIGTDAGDGGKVLRWLNGKGAVEWAFSVPEDGLYNLEVQYEPGSDSSASVLYGLMIDGKTPFAEAETVEFPKVWRDKTVPNAKDALGNEIRSELERIAGWRTMTYTDYNVSSRPIELYLARGEHKLRFVAMNEPMNWKSIRLVAPAAIPSYAEYARDAQPAASAGSWYEKIEAEAYRAKSSTSVQTGSRNEANVSPDPKGRIKYNVIDGERWKKPGEWVEWAFETPADGWYEIDAKYFQRYQGKTNVYRTIEIDGAVPFEEMLHYKFPYNGKLNIYTLQGENGEPYRFYLKQGKHVVRMIADASEVNPAFVSLTAAIDDIAQMERDVRQVTGDYGANVGDGNRTWELESYLPDIRERLRAERDRLNGITAYLNGLNQSATTVTGTLKLGASILDDMQANVDKIPGKLQKFGDLKSKLGAWLDTYNLQSMTVDYLVVREPGAEPGFKESSALAQIPYTVGNFVRTFYQKYDVKADDDSLEIWIGRGRDYANLLQEMIEQDFTAKTGIKVNVNLMPDANALTLSNAAGDQPDVALGVWQDVPVDFAMRGASADLTKFSDYEEIAKRFNPGAMRAFDYNQGVYALPETQSFPLLYYRKSVLERLGEDVPQTWDDVIRLLPSLQENGMTFHYPNKDFVPLFYANGAEFYTEDGLHPAFNTEEAYAGFKLWTDLYNKYGLPRDVPSFFNHFKLGDMPIGVSDFNTYLQLLSSAPEIRGDWGIAPIPGVLRDDGTITRWAQNGMMSAMILQKSDKKDQAWEFLKWWTSDDAQLRFGSDIESYYGIEYRWNTANMRALASMPWPSEDLETILEQNRWAKNVPNVPGGYFLARELGFAWNRVVVEKKPPKESLDKAFQSLDREMGRKQDNLGIDASDDLHVARFDRPFDWGAVRP